MAVENGCVYGIYNLKEGLLKIGQTTRPDYRFNVFGVGRDENIKLLFCIEVPGRVHHSVEILIQECVGNAKELAPHLPTPTEWYRVSLEHARTLGRIASDFVSLLDDGADSSHRSRFVWSAINAARSARSRVVRNN